MSFGIDFDWYPFSVYQDDDSSECRYYRALRILMIRYLLELRIRKKFVNH